MHIAHVFPKYIVLAVFKQSRFNIKPIKYTNSLLERYTKNYTHQFLWKNCMCKSSFHQASYAFINVYIKHIEVFISLSNPLDRCGLMGNHHSDMHTEWTVMHLECEYLFLAYFNSIEFRLGFGWKRIRELAPWLVGCIRIRFLVESNWIHFSDPSPPPVIGRRQEATAEGVLARSATFLFYCFSTVRIFCIYWDSFQSVASELAELSTWLHLFPHGE